MSTTERAQSDKKLKAKYNAQLSTLKELFTEWTEEDLLFTLQDADGDLELAIDRIADGHANQWGEVKTKKSKKEAAAANKVTAEPPTSTTTTSAPSYSTTYTTSSQQNNRSNQGSRPATTQPSKTAYQRPAASNSIPRQKPTAAASWQMKKTFSSTSGDSWSTKATANDSWSGNDGDAWSTKESNHSNSWSETPKKMTPSSSTKTSNSGGAKTWASLLHKEEPVVAEPTPISPVKKNEPLPQKTVDAWSSTVHNSTLNQWDQPIQLSVTEQEIPQQQQPETIQETDNVPLNFNNLSLEDKEPETQTSSNHPSVADILNSVKQQPPTADTVSKEDFSRNTVQNQAHVETKQTAPPQSNPEQPLGQQQFYQQQQYQQFGVQDYGNAFNNDYSMYGNDRAQNNYYDQQRYDGISTKEDASKTTATTTTATTSAAADQTQQPFQQFSHMYGNNMQQQQPQSFYPYYYMPNQFNSYSPYGQPQQQASNSFMRNNMYPTSVYGQQPAKTSGTPTASHVAATAGTSSPYLGGSPYNPSQQLYGGFNTTGQFDDFSTGGSNQFYSQQQQQFLSPQPPQAQTTETSTTSPKHKSPENQQQSQQQQQYGYGFGQSAMFSYGQQQQQPYRANHQQYWNQ